MNNLITVQSAIKREKESDKTSGLKAIFSLGQDIVDFQKKLESILESSPSDDVAECVKTLDSSMVETYKKLMEYAANGITSLRDNAGKITKDDSSGEELEDLESELGEYVDDSEEAVALKPKKYESNIVDSAFLSDRYDIRSPIPPRMR